MNNQKRERLYKRFAAAYVQVRRGPVVKTAEARTTNHDIVLIDLDDRDRVVGVEVLFSKPGVRPLPTRKRTPK